MEVKVRLIQKHRRYSVEFKRNLVALFEKGSYSVLQLSRLYGVSFGVIYKWIYQYSTLNASGCRIVEMKESATDKLKLLENRIKELEQLVGQKQIKVDFLEKMIDIAGEQLHVDIKKKFSTPQSTGSAKTKNN